MKAVAVRPGTANSIHQREMPDPDETAIAGGRGVRVRVLEVGVDGTDREINEAKYGRAPKGDDFLVTGHESLGVVEAVGPNAGDGLAPGTLCVATVRRPGTSVYDKLGRQDFTTDDVYYERGINLVHGYLAEQYADDCEWIVPVPDSLRDVAVLLEPSSISQKGLDQAYRAQQRLPVWEPKRAAVTGAGTIGMLAALAMRLRGLEVTTYSLREPPYLNSSLLDEIGVSYVCAKQNSFADASKQHGPFDIVFEATGYSPLAWEAAGSLGKNGVLLLSSVTGGDRTAEIPSDAINQSFVLGNKMMLGTVNASRGDFERGREDMLKAEQQFPGWLGRLKTTPIDGLGGYKEMIDHLENDREAIKVFVRLSQ